ncbi:MAG: dihydroneopterin aldolase [Propionibacteriaceae bacterium]|jgi:dihydroneopterin aldolase|nr:dihydroneopterin aldolase [Propionibacteriaceae bacterium]
MAEVVINLEGIEAFGVHGVLPAERLAAQRFVIDARCRLAAGPVDDDISSTVDYAELAGRIGRFVEDNSFGLLETLADGIARICLDYPAVRRARVRVHKPEAAMPYPVADVSVEVSHGR